MKSHKRWEQLPWKHGTSPSACLGQLCAQPSLPQSYWPGKPEPLAFKHQVLPQGLWWQLKDWELSKSFPTPMLLQFPTLRRTGNKTLYSSSGREDIHFNLVSCQLKRVWFVSGQSGFTLSSQVLFLVTEKDHQKVQKNTNLLTLVRKYLAYDGIKTSFVKKIIHPQPWAWA